MAQKYKQFIFADYNLGLNNSTIDYKNDGLARQICNVECKNGRLQSAKMFDNIFNLIEPTRAQIAQQVFLDQVGDCKWLTGYQFFHEDKHKDYVVFCNSQNKIFYYEMGANNPQFICLNNVFFTSTPKFDFFIKDNQNIMIFSSETDNMWVWDGINEPYQVLDAPKVTSMAVGLDRLFVVCHAKPYSVLFSDDLDPSNWSITAGEAGELIFSDNLGKVLMVFALDNYIYVMRENGIVKIYGYNKTENAFNVSRVYCSTGRIYKNSVAIAGDKIIFMCSDGIYSFDGLSVKKIYNNLNGLVFNGDKACAQCVDNIYFLCANMYENLNYSNALICIDLEQKGITNINYGYIFQNICLLTVKNINEVVVLTQDLLSKNANTPAYICKNRYKNTNNVDYLYFTHALNLQPQSSKKVLSKLTFLCKSDATICVETDTQTKEYHVKKSNFFQTIKINLKANIFAIKVYGKGDIDISHIKLDYCFME